MIRWAVRYLFILFSGSLFLPAGYVDGPYVVWVNLSMDSSLNEIELHNYLNNYDGRCWNETALMFVRSKPQELISGLLRSAILKRDKKAIA